MANKFSAVLLGDLNDFISPGQACINPIFVESTATTKPSDAKASTSEPKKKATIELTFDDIPTVTATKSLIKLDKSTKAAKVSLSDCLACSGCVTSAETVLMKQQSVQEFLVTTQAIHARLHPNFKVSVVSISPQVRASLAIRFGCTPTVAFAKVAYFMRRFCGVEIILDNGSLASDIAQLEVAKDFVNRYRRKQHDNSQTLLPLLTSNCPGWVCYAEKTHPHAIPHLSEIKSPQQVAGSILKRSLQETRGLAPNEVYHVTIMQCPDKKLEASRKEFWLGPTEQYTEVNSVLTATELCDAILEVLQSENLDEAFASLEGNPSSIITNELEGTFGACVTSEAHNAGASGGLCAFVFRFAAQELFGLSIPSSTRLPFKPGRNPDTWSLDLEIDGKVVLRFAASYGFRNIQDVVRRIKNGTNSTHFVEVMACPGGCTNGGGLLPPFNRDDSVANRRALADEVAKAMERIPQYNIGENSALQEVISKDESALKTSFNAIKDIFKVNEGLNQTW